MKTKIILVAIAVAVIILGGVVYLVLRGTSPNGGGATGGNLPPVPTSTANTATGPFPSGDTFVIGTGQGGVTVKNFYNTKDYITGDQQTVVLAENDNYTFVYDRGDSGFIIALISGPLKATRDAAEAAFLDQVGVSKSDACKLTVDERIVDKTSPHDGEMIGLSFCPGAMSF